MAGCPDQETGPIRISAIGSPPKLSNPNMGAMDPPSALLLESVAQGLVRFDAAGQIEPGLAQSWIVSDDGLRYTFRLRRSTWPDGRKVTAEQVARLLRAAAGRTSRNPLKPLLGAVEEIVHMTDDVLEISLRAPRPHFLQLLAQPEMAILRNGGGTGPFAAVPQPVGGLLLVVPRPADPDEAEQDDAREQPTILLRGEAAAMAVARYDAGLSDLVTGGTAGDLPIARAAEPPPPQLSFDPVAGLLGLAFVRTDGPFADAAARQALSMAIDRAGITAALAVPGLQPRESLLPAGVEELQPALPAWAGTPLPARQALARRALATDARQEPLTVRVATPPGPGYRLIFAHLRRDWRAVGLEARQVGMRDAADVQLVDAVAPIGLASWYLRRFSCEQSPVCDPAADEAMAAARIARDVGTRRTQLANADRILADAAPFIPIAAPVRWSLVSPRLTGFRPNMLGRHPLGELIAPRR